MKKKILVTGGTGYIGSHTVVELIANGYDTVILDNLSNSKEAVIDRLYKITGKKVKFYQADLCDKPAVAEIFKKENFTDVIHFAGLKAVGESVSKPLYYYRNNIYGTINLLECMREAGVKNIVFSSSATVYGDPERVPITENFPLSATNPYGQTKLMIEQILRDIYRADPSFNIALLRYFNPIGAHESGLIGEDPNGIPNNLAPYITKVAAGKLQKISVFGNDYPTPDGTGVRDYIHVVDLAKGHIAALKKIDGAGLLTVNLGTGKGYSVLDVIKAFSKAVGRELPYVFTARRPGDIAVCYADPSLAKKLLGWEAKAGIEKMAEDGWRWQLQNPDGL
ncbi:MAG: UDP-glucose 4-epimerase GalE [Clostridiaceae bacterium]|jgi:UDP-glucose 4-epimerase|nr:UDP-glucose 4-epimerase GalE [Clostridiaceae bacterium]